MNLFLQQQSADYNFKKKYSNNSAFQQTFGLSYFVRDLVHTISNNELRHVNILDVDI